MADLSKKRATVPAAWEAAGSIKVPGFSLQTLLNVAAGQLVGGPIGGAVALASEVLSAPNVVGSAETFYYMSGAVNHILQALKTTGDLITEDEKDALEKIALVLGYPPTAPATLPATATAKRLEEVILMHKAAMGETVGAGEEAVYVPFLKKIAEKKSPDWWSVEITIHDYPKNQVRHEFSNGNKLVIGLGRVAWTYKNFTLKEEFVNFTRFRSIAPFPGIEDVTFQKYEDVTWVMQKKKFDPLEEEPPE